MAVISLELTLGVMVVAGMLFRTGEGLTSLNRNPIDQPDYNVSVLLGEESTPANWSSTEEAVSGELSFTIEEGNSTTRPQGFSEDGTNGTITSTRRPRISAILNPIACETGCDYDQVAKRCRCE